MCHTHRFLNSSAVHHVLTGISCHQTLPRIGVLVWVFLTPLTESGNAWGLNVLRLAIIVKWGFGLSRLPTIKPADRTRKVQEESFSSRLGRSGTVETEVERYLQRAERNYYLCGGGLEGCVIILLHGIKSSLWQAGPNDMDGFECKNAKAIPEDLPSCCQAGHLSHPPRHCRLGILMECRSPSDGKAQFYRKIWGLYIWQECGKSRILDYYCLWKKKQTQKSITKPKNNLHLFFWLELSAEENQTPIQQDIRALLRFSTDAMVYSDFIGFNLNLKKKPKLLRFFQSKT